MNTTILELATLTAFDSCPIEMLLCPFVLSIQLYADYARTGESLQLFHFLYSFFVR